MGCNFGEVISQNTIVVCGTRFVDHGCNVRIFFNNFYSTVTSKTKEIKHKYAIGNSYYTVVHCKLLVILHITEK